MRTLDSHRPTAEAIGGVGARIVAIGSSASVRRRVGRDAVRIDAAGKVVLPGLIDPHLHLVALAAREAHFDVGDVDGIDALRDRIRRHATTLAPGEWVRGEGLDEARLERLPTLADIDGIAPGHPIRLRHRSRHASLLDREAVSRLPPSVPHRRGLVAGHEEAVTRLVGRLPARMLARGFASLGRELLATGITTVADATPRSWTSLAPVRRALADGFPVHVVAMQRDDARRWRARTGLSPGPVKIMVHEEGDWIRPTPAVLARRIARAASAGHAVAVHCLGSATLAATLAAFEGLPARWRRGRGHRLEHVAECPPAFVPRIAALGLTVVTNPAFVWARGDVYREAADGPPAAWLYRAHSLCAAGVVVTGSSDAPIGPLSPWRAIAAARNRRTRGGWVLGPAERLSAAHALALYTTAAAGALGDDRRGRLRVGGRADLIVVDRDPLVVTARAVRDTRVLATIVGGRLAWQA